MANLSLKKLIEQLQVEVDATYLYKQLSIHYHEGMMGQILFKMSEIEEGHAKKVLAKITAIDPQHIMPGPSLRAKIQLKLGQIFGYEYILSYLTTLESQVSQSIIAKKQAEGEKITGLENLHFNIMQHVSKQTQQGVRGSLLSKFEGKHKSVSGNELRAAVLGANDGLVSNMSLVMGVAGAAYDNQAIFIAGIAGLLAGSISMALGEWLSVQSSRELYQRQIEIEEQELETSPEEELKELVLLYQAKGMTEEEANKLAENVFANKETALESLVKEELGIDKTVLGGSAWKAAFTSFFLFAIGAIIPVFPYIFISGQQAIFVSLIGSTLGLFALGASITLFTGKNAIYGGIRQMIFGISAAAITYTIGKLIGVSLGT
jgi:VIT1/CCC1 family predicted Fe2+/Mn2+ transporter